MELKLAAKEWRQDSHDWFERHLVCLVLSTRWSFHFSGLRWHGLGMPADGGGIAFLFREMDGRGSDGNDDDGGDAL